MFSVFVNAWRVPDLRKKLLYVLLILAIYRLGCHIPLPLIDVNALLEYQSGGAGDSLYSFLVGGGTGSIMAMGIGPYITSSIIMQLLTVAIPKLEQLQKEGEEGRKKINQYTRVVAVALAVLQGGGTVYTLHSFFVYQNFLVYIMATTAIVTGTIFIMWLSELLTERGIGNGSSFIIFANILSGLPSGVLYFYYTGTGADVWTWLKIILVLALHVVIIGFVIMIQDGERKIPVQYSKKMVGRQMYGGSSTYIPIKVNIAGVMSIIFAISLLQLPAQINGFVNSESLSRVVRVLDHTHVFGALLYVFLIFCFTFFYTSFAVNPIEMAENLRKNGGSIPGIRSGKPTSDFIQKTVDRLSWIGAVFYAVIAMVPTLIQWIFGLRVGFGGTTLIIVTGVALEIVKQIESQLLMRHYKGFLNN